MAENRQFEDKFVLRMPDGMRSRLKEIANENRRSMNAEILIALEKHATERKKPEIA